MDDSMKHTMSDHDLLIVLHTKVERLLNDVQEVKDNVVSRVGVLEMAKLDKTEANKLLEEAIRAANTIHEAHEKRICDLEDDQVQTRLEFSNFKTQVYAVVSVLIFLVGIAEFLLNQWFATK